MSGVIAVGVWVGSMQTQVSANTRQIEKTDEAHRSHVKDDALAVEGLKDYMQKVDRRLSRIEGALGVRGE